MYQLLNVSLVQGESLPKNRAYLVRCLMVPGFKTNKFCKGVKTLPTEIKINCNMGTVLGET